MTASTETKTNQTTNQQTDPWAGQIPFLKQAFSGASDALTKAQGTAAPSDFVAGMTPDQMATFNKMVGFGNNTGTAEAVGNTGAGLVAPGAQGILSAMGGFGGFKPAGSTADNIAAANQYADNVDVSGAVTAAMRDANRQANEVTIPGMEYGAANTGNINSSRVGLAEGVVKRGLAEKAGDLSATLRNAAFSDGLNATMQQNQMDNSSKLGALSGLLSAGSGAAGTGANISSNSINDIGNLFQLAASGGAGQQQGNQLGLDNEAQKYAFGTNAPFDALKNFFSIIGANNWGGTTVGNTTGTGSSSTNNPIGMAAGLMGATGSLLKSDRNAKIDIAIVGELHDGMPVYRFRYADDPHGPMYIGLMAQDVEQVTPDAVLEIDGFKHVDYEIATDHLAATVH